MRLYSFGAIPKLGKETLEGLLTPSLSRVTPYTLPFMPWRNTQEKPLPSLFGLCNLWGKEPLCSANRYVSTGMDNLRRGLHSYLGAGAKTRLGVSLTERKH
jgi:hypothetical protein